jgi:tRNA(Ser,Leu) C12 N-acetylase TAN1
MSLNPSTGVTIEEAPPSRVWNVLATAKNHQQRHLVRLLKGLGDFWWSPFLGVLLGRVEDHEAFFDQLRRYEEDRPGSLHPLAKLVPLVAVFSFRPDTLADQLRAAVLSYRALINGGSFHVRIERRGHAGEIHAQALEQELDRSLLEALREQDTAPRIDFKDPDVIIAVEFVGDECGVGALTKRMRERYSFLKVA